ncbi:MAG TPA: hypothetical protein VKK79_21965, partial [Candidatus Lokiarchaeia archaeon]|nr:hypothetical protein [Candidatus Lokiarchaeia archaeon]
MQETTEPWRFFLFAYLKAFFFRPKIHVNHQQWVAFLFNRLVEIPIILVLWMFSKVSPRIEGEFARILSKKWRFQLLPKEASLSTQALNYKHEKTLAVNVTVNTQTTVLDFATISEISRNFPFCSVAECGCRSVVGHCDAPRHTCLVLRWAADSTHTIQNRAQYQLPTRAELEKILDQADKWALVNMALSYPDDAHTYAVCSCCDCCCVAFREFRANAVPFMVGSRFVA